MCKRQPSAITTAVTAAPRGGGARHSPFLCILSRHRPATFQPQTTGGSPVPARRFSFLSLLFFTEAHKIMAFPPSSGILSAHPWPCLATWVLSGTSRPLPVCKSNTLLAQFLSPALCPWRRWTRPHPSPDSLLAACLSCVSGSLPPAPSQHSFRTQSPSLL